MNRARFPLPQPLARQPYHGLRVGLFGGSFNPAHAAHRQLAQHALQQLKLDVIWWLVSPQNPLKSADDMADYAQRLTSARLQAEGPRMVVSDLEAQLGTRYTADTIARLQKKYPHTHFTWLMGADSFRTFHLWQDWRGIARRVPMAIFARPPAQLRALSGFAAKTLRQWRVKGIPMAPREWRYVRMPLNPLSATEIRNHHAQSSKENQSHTK